MHAHGTLACGGVHVCRSLPGIVDIVELKELRFDQSIDGSIYTESSLSGELHEEALEKRIELIDTLGGYDDQLAEHIINNESLENVDNDLIHGAIRRTTMARHIVPVLLGSSYKHIGVQRLMNAVVSYLPAPSDTDVISDCFG